MRLVCKVSTHVVVGDGVCASHSSVTASGICRNGQEGIREAAAMAEVPCVKYGRSRSGSKWRLDGHG